MYLNENYNPYSESAESETPVQNGAKVKKQKTHKKGHFKKFIAWICTAVLLGGFAGAAFYGVYYAGSKVIPVKQNKTTISSTANNGNNSSGTQVSSTDTKKEIKATVMDVSELVDSVITSVVAISGEVTSYNYGFFGGEQQKSAVSGSGIIIGVNDDEVIFVTNAHVIDGVDEGTIKVKLYDGTELSAYVKGSKTAYDLAVIAVKKSDVPSDAVYSVATLGDSTKIKVGESAIVVGNAMGTGISVTTGIVSALNKTITVSNTEYKDLIQTDAAINPGNSGGALFNAEGEVMGISSVKLSTTSVEGMGYAISVSSVKEVIEELSNSKNAKVLYELNRFPVIFASAHVSPFANAWLNRVSGILLPVGLFLWFRMWKFRLRLFRDMKQIVSSCQKEREYINEILPQTDIKLEK